MKIGEIRDVYIIAYKENCTVLERFLKSNGFKCHVLRYNYSEHEMAYSAHIRCLINHSDAWKAICDTGRPTIIVEADFVPCRNFADLPAPFALKGVNSARFGWLYTAGSTLYGIDADGFPFGHGNATVAYLLTPSAAQACLEFFRNEMNRNDPGAYRPWETRIGIFLRREKGILNYIPIYQYGEHGGISNSEHASAGHIAWHQADVLWSRLAFLPQYANGSTLKFALIRLRGWLRGVYQVLTLQYFHPAHINTISKSGPAYLAGFTFLRLLKLAKIPRLPLPVVHE